MAHLATAAVGGVTTVSGCSMDKDPWRDVPAVEARLIDELKLPDRVANAYHWGGYLDYAWNGRRKVFVDGRNQLFENGAFEDAQRLSQLVDWTDVLDRNAINTVLWERGSPLDWALSRSADWLLVRRGRIAVVYTRREPILVLARPEAAASGAQY